MTGNTVLDIADQEGYLVSTFHSWPCGEEGHAGGVGWEWETGKIGTHTLLIRYWFRMRE